MRARVPQYFPKCHSLSICGSVYEFMCALEFVGMLVGDRGRVFLNESRQRARSASYGIPAQSSYYYAAVKDLLTRSSPVAPKGHE